MDLIGENESQRMENKVKTQEISQLNEAISKLKFYESPGYAFNLENKYMLENKVKETERDYKNIYETNQKTQVEYKILNEKYESNKRQLDDLLFETSQNRIKETERINLLEIKSR